MRTSLLTPNLNTTLSVDVAAKDTRKPAAPTPSADRPFERALSHARKPATTETSHKTEKPKSNKTVKAKPGKTGEVEAKQSKKPERMTSKANEDSDADEESAGAHQEDANSKRDPASANTENTDGTDSPQDEPSDHGADSATISSDAKQSAAGDAQTPATVTPKVPTQSATQSANKSDSTAASAAAAAEAASGSAKAIAARRDPGVKTGSSNGAATASRPSTDIGSSTSTATSASLSSHGTTIKSALETPKSNLSPVTTTAAADTSADGDDDSGASPSVAGDVSDQTNPGVLTTQTDSTSTASAAPATPSALDIGQSSFANFAQSLASASPAPTQGANLAATTRTAINPPTNPGAKFVAENHPSIVQSVKTELLPTGGTMKLRLDPPELGAMQVSVHVKDGVVTASFETTNDQATKMLSHSLGQLKQALESQGITVGKIHVQQSARDEGPTNSPKDGESESNQQNDNTSSSSQDDQRRETLRRMWERLSTGGDPLDLVA